MGMRDNIEVRPRQRYLFGCDYRHLPYPTPSHLYRSTSAIWHYCSSSHDLAVRHFLLPSDAFPPSICPVSVRKPELPGVTFPQR